MTTRTKIAVAVLLAGHTALACQSVLAGGEGVIYDDGVLSRSGTLQSFEAYREPEQPAATPPAVDLSAREPVIEGRAKADEALEASVRAAEEAHALAQQTRREAAEAHARSDELLAAAEKEAERRIELAKTQLAVRSIDPAIVMNEQISGNFVGATIREIAEGLMPENWTVRTDFSKYPELDAYTLEFVTTQRRGEAMNTLANFDRTRPLQVRYFYDLMDGSGNAAPLVIITDQGVAP